MIESLDILGLVPDYVALFPNKSNRFPVCEYLIHFHFKRLDFSADNPNFKLNSVL